MSSAPASDKVDNRTESRPIFSAYEVGKIAKTSYDIARITEGKIKILTQEMTAADILDLYENYPELDYLPVQAPDEKIVGYVQRQMFLAALSQNRFSRELLLRKDVTVDSIMERQVVSLDAYTTLPEASKILMQREENIRFDPFVITLEGHYYGISDVRKVLDGINFYLNLDMNSSNEAQEAVIHDGNSSLVYDNVRSKMRYDFRVMPLKGPGGDFATRYDLNENLSLFLLFDVCGKGLKASNMVMNIASVFRTWASMLNPSRITFSNLNMQETAYKMNQLVYQMTPGDMYATGGIILIDIEEKVLQLFDYGHGFIWLKRKDKVFDLSPSDNRSVDLTHMPFFGINDDFRLRPINYRLKSGDMIHICSDGIVEAFNPEKEEFQDFRIKETMAQYNGSDPVEFNDLLLQKWEDFRQGYRRTDDVSMHTIIID